MSWPTNTTTTIREVQQILRTANHLPFAFEVEDGQVFAAWVDLKAVSKADAKRIANLPNAIECDKGIVWTA